MDVLWNRIILMQLWNAIFSEFGENKLLLSKPELMKLKRMFKGVELSRLLNKSEYKAAVKHEKMEKRLVLFLYSIKCYQLLNFYMKILKYTSKETK